MGLDSVILTATFLEELIITSKKQSKPQPSELKKIKGVCFDIDETLSTHGKLTAEAYQALWNLKNAGFGLVAITGRPAGWCDHFARFWPVDAVVGENGAFTFFMSGGKRRRVDTPSKGRKSVESLKKIILKKYPHAKFASDQNYREVDLAIDFCEDVKPWTKAQVNRLVEVCEDAGAHVKVSSIHVNAWFGEHDKETGFRYWLKKGSPGLRGKKISFNSWVFIGDSPNDEPLFKAFKYSVGVANLKKFMSDIRHRPKWLTQNESGAGFCELSRCLVHSKRS